LRFAVQPAVLEFDQGEFDRGRRWLLRIHTMHWHDGSIRREPGVTMK